MKILGVLQNQWVRDPERIGRMVASMTSEERRQWVGDALFMGCKTGRVIRSVFGEKLAFAITWENASPVITGRSDGNPPPDPAHLYRAVSEVRPDIVLCFGVNARKAVAPMLAKPGGLPPGVDALKVFYLPHPCARNPQDQRRLRDVAADVKAAAKADPVVAGT